MMLFWQESQQCVGKKQLLYIHSPRLKHCDVSDKINCFLWHHPGWKCSDVLLKKTTAFHGTILAVNAVIHL